MALISRIRCKSLFAAILFGMLVASLFFLFCVLSIGKDYPYHRKYFPSHKIAFWIIVNCLLSLSFVLMYLVWSLYRVSYEPVTKSLQILFVLVLATGISAYMIERPPDFDATEAFLTKSVVNYREVGSNFDMDTIQRELQCCGVESLMDWSRNRYYKCSPNDSQDSAWKCQLPKSCFLDKELPRTSRTPLPTINLSQKRTGNYETQDLFHKNKKFRVRYEDKIYIVGCMNKMRSMWFDHRDVMRKYYIILGVIVVLLTLFLVKARTLFRGHLDFNYRQADTTISHRF